MKAFGLVVIVFLRNWRLTGIILLAIPLSILAAIIGLFYTGDTINAMTLGGLALAVGILIDQSIVVLENIVRHARDGKSPFDAALDGTREVALPILVDGRPLGRPSGNPGPVFFHNSVGVLTLGSKNSPFTYEVEIQAA